MSAAAARTAFTLFAGGAYDPTAAGGLVAWQRPNGVALLARGDDAQALPGGHPALGGQRIAWIDGTATVVADAASLGGRARYDTPGAGVIAVSDAALAWRARDAGGIDRLWARLLGQAGEPRLLLEAAAPAEIGRPAIAGGTVLCHVAGPRGSQLLAIDAATGAQTLLRAEPGAQLTNPSTDGTRLLYVRATGRQQELRVGAIAPGVPTADRLALVHASPGHRDREHEHGRHRHRQGYRGKRPPLPPRAAKGTVATLWSTALAADAAYVTRLRAISGRPRTADILRVAVRA